VRRRNLGYIGRPSPALRPSRIWQVQKPTTIPGQGWLASFMEKPGARPRRSIFRPEIFWYVQGPRTVETKLEAIGCCEEKGRDCSRDNTEIAAVIDAYGLLLIIADELSAHRSICWVCPSPRAAERRSNRKGIIASGQLCGEDISRKRPGRRLRQGTLLGPTRKAGKHRRQKDGPDHSTNRRQLLGHGGNQVQRSLDRLRGDRATTPRPTIREAGRSGRTSTSGTDGQAAVSSVGKSRMVRHRDQQARILRGQRRLGRSRRSRPRGPRRASEVALDIVLTRRRHSWAPIARWHERRSCQGLDRSCRRLTVVEWWTRWASTGPICLRNC